MEKEVPDFIRYEIEERKYSCNALMGVYLAKNEKGEDVERKRYILAIALPKKYADEQVEKIKNFFNNSLILTNGDNK
jgi:hypothetical protein